MVRISRFDKLDAKGQRITKGSVCVGYTRPTGLFYCVYKDSTNRSVNGEYGRFITKDGIKVLKFKNVMFLIDLTHTRPVDNDEIRQLTKMYYEE